MTNYFQLFHFEIGFDIDLSELKSRYQQLQKLTHPDLFVNASEQEKRLYMQKNAQVNDAYQVLSSPVLRAEHILSLQNVALPDPNATLGDTDFLMQQMELREAMQEANSAEQIQALKAQISAQQKDLEAQIKQSLQAKSDEANEQASQALTKLKFFTKLILELDERS